MSIAEPNNEGKPVQCGLDSFSDLFGKMAETCLNPECSAIPPIGRKYCDGACRAEASRIRRQDKRQEQRDEEYSSAENFDERNPVVYSVIKSSFCELAESPRRAIEGFTPNINAIIEYEIRMLRSIKIPNAYKKYYREKFIREHPEYKELFK